MQALDIKMLRDLRRLWPQALAIALVMAAGVATLILGVGAYDSLSTTRSRYYDSNRFADVFASVERAPTALRNEISRIDGVAAVETRISQIAMADIGTMSEPASVQLMSLPQFGDPLLNRIYLRTGRLPELDAQDEAVASDGFAKAHGLEPGDHVRVLINGRKREITITGTALSPEFIYALGPGDLMPDPRRFGILWMPERALAAAYDLDGAFSSVSLKLTPGTREEAVIERLDLLLDRYGGRGAFGRKDQISHAFLDAELQQLQSMSRVLPPIFLVVAAFMVNMTLSRLIALEREQIGLLKAMGYSSWNVAWHYLRFVSVIAAVGILIGFVAGSWLGMGMAALYAKFFSFPFLIFSRNPAVYAIAAIVTYVSAVAGAAKAVSDVAWLSPAVAMLPPAPQRYRQVFAGALDMSRMVRQSSVIIVRHLTHWPWRTASGILGMALAVAILVGSLWSTGSIEYMIDVTFHRSDRQDASINFSALRPMSALFETRRLPGVMRAEPYRAIAVKLRNGHVERRLSLIGKPPDTELSRVLTADLKPVVLPEEGIVISKSVAELLDLRRGDKVEIEVLEGRRQTLLQPVSAVIEGYIGLTAFMNIGALNRALDEGTMISGVNIAFDPLHRIDLFTALKATPMANFIALQYVSVARFRETLAQNITIMITLYTALAGIIAFGVVYNFARISLSEQGREMASLRVLGFTKGEVAALILGELATVVILAQPLGWLIGYGFAYAVVSGFSTELYRVPLIINRDVYAWSSIIVIAAAVISGLLVRRRIDRLDMIAVLKTRE
jgi:putative ABC transport system permease protein